MINEYVVCISAIVKNFCFLFDKANNTKLVELLIATRKNEKNENPCYPSSFFVYFLEAFVVISLLTYIVYIIMLIFCVDKLRTFREL